MSVLKKIWNYYKRYGFKLLIFKFMDRQRYDFGDYMKWRSENLLNENELKHQREECGEENILISIAVPVYHTPEKFLREMIESLQNQTYKNWELCIADASKDDVSYNILSEYAMKESRIKVKKLKDNKGISENTNEAFAMCQGEYIGLLDHDDLLEVNALYEVNKAIIARPEVEVLYSDEDKISMDGAQFFEPHFKSDFNEELLRSNNYICHFLVVKNSLIKSVGGLRKEYDGAQDYDFVLRCTEKAEVVVHIPKVLYHWRAHRDSTAENPESKMYAYESGKRAIEAQLKRRNEKGIVSHKDYWGFYHVTYDVFEQDKVTIVVLQNQCSKKQIKKCISSIKKTVGYSNYEICVAENLSDVQCKQIHGKYVLIVSGAISMITTNWMQELLGLCQRKQVGAVGIKLYNPDETIKHAGIILGMDGYAFEGWPRVRPGYFHRESLMQNLNAVSQLFVMFSKEMLVTIKKELKESIDNEMLFCEKIRDMGKTIVYNPNIEAYYQNSVNMKRLKCEQEDCFYNVNLELTAPGYRVKR